ncbi:hypothetical protein MVES1_000317 [Malassezia vespertilionis]|uniref:uncharacterized protein n=1 Tax=Malassezia vespertilionis TaxID=2020962 RepID=UPI0024B24C65|nr:uncharacterized protein MVES1_000317 [Malassezia vespertilionis]WFD04992.1 hypothetical protein MVES1_000317 [Malassezia vespertilionis]
MAEAASTVFVGGISPGVNDRWLIELLKSCGSFRSFKRVSKAFGFADFLSAHDVLRALAVLNGVELPSMGVDVGLAPKCLVVKADEKTTAFLDEFQKTLVRTDDDAQEERKARARAMQIVGMMRAQAGTGADADVNVYEIPAHLKDLRPEELGANRPANILSEIEKFRIAAVARDAEDRRRTLEVEKRRAAASQDRVRSFSPAHAPSDVDDPEAADVAAEQARCAARTERIQREASEAERIYARKEQDRVAYWRAQYAECAPQHKARLWEPQEDAEFARELFWLDRRRWLHMRAAEVARERAADDADRHAQRNEEEKARQEAEAFLAEQEREMAEFAERQRASGLLVHDGAPLRLHVHMATDEGVKRRLALAERLRGARSEDAIRHVLPADDTQLFAITPDWSRLDISSYTPLLDAGIEASFGEVVEDLRDAALEKLREEASAQEVLDVLEPVLDDEAPALVASVWRALLLDSLRP